MSHIAVSPLPSLSPPPPLPSSSQPKQKMQQERRVVHSRTPTSSSSNPSGSNSVPVVSYETFAPRSTAQLSRLHQLANWTAGPVVVSAATNTTPTPSWTQYSPPSINDWDDNDIGGFLVDSDPSNDDSSSLSFSSSLLVLSSLSNHMKHIVSLRLALQASINIAHELHDRHDALLQHSGALTKAADQLQDEYAQLSRHALDLGRPLVHYDAVDRIGMAVGVWFKPQHNNNKSKNNDMIVVRGLAKIKVDHDEYPRTLDEIDRAIDFFGRECGGIEALQQLQLQQQQQTKNRSKEPQSQQQQSGSLEYFRRALILQEAALSLVKEAVADRITTTTQQVTDILKLHATSTNTNTNTTATNSTTTTSTSSSSSSTPTVSADQLEASLIYTRFHGISARSNRLVSLLRTRAQRNANDTSTHTSTILNNNKNNHTNHNNNNPYAELLHECISVYCTSREALLKRIVQAHMDQLKVQHGPVGMTRLGSIFLLRLCSLETQLFFDFFGESSNDESGENERTGHKEEGNSNPTKSPTTTTAAGAKNVNNMKNTNHEAVYNNADFQTYLTSLCNSLHTTLRRSLVTTQDLDTLCQIVSVLREERTHATNLTTTLSSSTLSSSSFMAAARAMILVMKDAQERLIFCAHATLTREVIRFKALPKDLDYPDKLSRQGQKEEEEKTDDTRTNNTSSRSNDEVIVVSVYDSWYPPLRSVLKILSKIFRVVDAKVFEDMALSSVQALTKCLRDAASYIHKRSSVLDADLFLVKHLLTLREQLSPFDIELRSVEKQLDFSDAGKAVARFLANRNRRLFSMSSTENALLTLLREGVSVQESAIDSKRDLEQALKAACNDFIDHCAARMATDELLALAEQFRNSSTVAAVSTESSYPADADRVTLIIVQAHTNIHERTVAVTDQLKLYLENPGTHSILLKPVSRKVTRAKEDLTRMMMESRTNDSSNGWDADKRDKMLQWLEEIESAVKMACKVSK